MTSPAAPSVSSSSSPPATRRLLSLDALRGFDMFWILGADDSVYALQAAGQGGALAFFATQLEHADWVGFRCPERSGTIPGIPRDC